MKAGTRFLSHFAGALRVSLALFLILSTTAILYTTIQSTRSAESLADRSLESTALALSLSAENAWRSGGPQAMEKIREIFSDRVVAYALIAARDGKILFHTNPRQMGSRLDEGEEPEWSSQTPAGRRILLGMGIPAYEFDYIFRRADGGPELLRLVLQTLQADRIIADVRRMWWTVIPVLILLWTLGILLERIFSRQLRLQGELEKRKELALIGQMTAVLAHEIRNALGSMKGYAQWVDEKIDPTDPKKAGLTAVIRGAERIEALVRELLQFSREESFQVEKVNLEPLLQEAFQSAISSWKGKTEWIVPGPLWVMADSPKLHRVLINGIRNAIQSMGDGGRLGIAVRTDGRWVTIEITDSGPGISAGEISRLFTPFHTTKPDGTGLGLAYSKRVIEGMGGEINLTNRKEGGAALTIQLHRAKGKSNGKSDSRDR